MTQQLQRYGEEYMQKFAWRQDLIARDSPEEIIVGVYNEATDNIGSDETLNYDGAVDSDAKDDIGTEPTDGNYAQKTFSLDSTDVSITLDNGDIFMDIIDHTWDMTNTTGTVDHYFILGRFQSNQAGDSAQDWNLLAVGPLEQSYDLSNVDQLENTNAGIKLN